MPVLVKIFKLFKKKICKKLNQKIINNNSQNTTEEIFENSNTDFTAVKLKEIQSWISNKVYDVVPQATNKCTSLGWVLTNKNKFQTVLFQELSLLREIEKDCLAKFELRISNMFFNNTSSYFVFYMCTKWLEITFNRY